MYWFWFSNWGWGERGGVLLYFGFNICFRFANPNSKLRIVKNCISKFPQSQKTKFSDFCSEPRQSARAKNLSKSQAMEKGLFPSPPLRKTAKKRVRIFCDSRKSWRFFCSKLAKQRGIDQCKMKKTNCFRRSPLATFEPPKPLDFSSVSLMTDKIERTFAAE